MPFRSLPSSERALSLLRSLGICEIVVHSDGPEHSEQTGCRAKINLQTEDQNSTAVRALLLLLHRSNLLIPCEAGAKVKHNICSTVIQTHVKVQKHMWHAF